MPALMWFRRDLRLLDNPALIRAAEAGEGGVVPLFVIDPALWEPAGAARRAYLTASLRALNDELAGHLIVLNGDPVEVVARVVALSGARSVHVAADFGGYGQRRDEAVARTLGSIPLVRTGSAHAIAPGTIRKDDGTPYRVFTPFYKAWLKHGWHTPAGELSSDVAWARPIDGDRLPDVELPDGLVIPAAGERAAWQTWSRFREVGAATYANDRDRPDLDSSSRMSTALRWGEVHPRSLLAELNETDEAWRRQLCWRDFYGDVLFHNPHTTVRSLDARFDEPTLWATDADDMFTSWAEGRTGYPFVDAGMRQLRREGWMHNRVRMVVASFLVKDLHLPWQRGAREFANWLTDADTANNVHGWQWTAGCGTDASPYYRIFNPVTQGLKFDPDGEYVRRYIPELAHLPGKAAHEPWDHADGLAHGYPERIVDHAAERDVALALLPQIKAMPRG